MPGTTRARALGAGRTGSQDGHARSAARRRPISQSSSAQGKSSRHKRMPGLLRGWGHYEARRAQTAGNGAGGTMPTPVQRASSGGAGGGGSVPPPEPPPAPRTSVGSIAEPSPCSDQFPAAASSPSPAPGAAGSEGTNEKKLASGSRVGRFWTCTTSQSKRCPSADMLSVVVMRRGAPAF